MIQQFLIILGSICLVCAHALAASAIEAPRAELTSESLGGSEFESLGDELLQGIPLPKKEVGKPVAQPPVPGMNAASSPLERVEYGMREAQSFLSQPKEESRAVAVQQQVVTELDLLITQLREAQCKACQGGKPAKSPGSRRSKMAGKKPSPSSAKSQSAATSTAQQSSKRLDSGQSSSTQDETVDEMLKRLWGQLPERVREQMLQTPADEFLPKYRAEIEKYFRRLAEEDIRKTTPNRAPWQSPQQ